MKLNTKRTLFVGLAFMIISMFWGVYDVVVPKMLVNTFGLGHTASGVVMALDNVFALFMLPFFGSLSDKCTSKYGKRTPFIVFGTIAAACLVTGVAIFDGIQLNILNANNIPAKKTSNLGLP